MKLRVEEKIHPLAGGVLKVQFVDGGRVVLAQITQGEGIASEIYEALDSLGIRFGVLDKWVDEIGGGYRGEVPVAVAEVSVSPAKIEGLDDMFALIDRLISSGDFSSLAGLNILARVESGDTLLKMHTPPQTVLRYPDDESRVLRNGHLNARILAGRNTTVSDDGTEISAAVDGVAHQNLYGEVSVHPMENMSRVTALDGKIRHEAAIMIEDDVEATAHVVTKGDIHISGTDYGALLQAAGNIQVNGLTENRGGGAKASVRAGGHFKTFKLHNTRVITGGNLIVEAEIRGCDIVCGGTLASPTLSGSQVKVGHRIVVGDIKDDTSILMGIQYLDESDYESKLTVVGQYEARMADRRAVLSLAQDTITDESRKVSEQLRRLKDPKLSPTQRTNAMRILANLTKQIETTLETFRVALEAFASAGHEVLDRQAPLEFYRQRLDAMRPEIIVWGTVEAGTKIASGALKLTIAEPASKIRITVDPEAEELVTEPLTVSEPSQPADESRLPDAHRPTPAR